MDTNHGIRLGEAKSGSVHFSDGAVTIRRYLGSEGGSRDGGTSVAGSQAQQCEMRALRNLAHGQERNQRARLPQCDRWTQEGA